MVLVFMVALQPLWTTPAYAIEPEQQTGPPPVSGSPHLEVKQTNDFVFNWQYEESTVHADYLFRISRSKAELDNESSKAVWYSPPLSEARLQASVIPDFHDGWWYWQVLARDNADNRSSWSAVWEVKVDSEGPIVEITSPSSMELIGRKEVMFEAAITETELGAYIVELDGNDITSQMNLHAETETLHMTRSWPSGELGDGLHVFEISATDMGGHVSRLETSVTVDTESPEVTTLVVENDTVRGDIVLDMSTTEPHLGSMSLEVTTLSGEPVAGLRAPTIDNNGRMLTRDWDTREVSDGMYRVSMIAVDAAGNQTSFVRNILVSNPVLTGQSMEDPLLAELSASLNQPLAAVQPYSPGQLTQTAASPDISQGEMHPYDRLLEEVPQFTAVAATENGWQLFGVLWYWWLLGGVALSVTGMYSRRILERTPRQQLSDSI